jgi:hypothetical protein
MWHVGCEQAANHPRKECLPLQMKVVVDEVRKAGQAAGFADCLPVGLLDCHRVSLMLEIVVGCGYQ